MAAASGASNEAFKAEKSDLSSRALSRLFANYKTRRASRTTDGKRNNGEHDLFKRVQKSVTSAKPDLKLLREILGL
jgi:hypothetical protein